CLPMAPPGARWRWPAWCRSPWSCRRPCRHCRRCRWPWPWPAWRCCRPGACGWRSAATATRAGCSTTPAWATAAAACGRSRPGCRGPACSTSTSSTARWNAASASRPWWCTPPAPATAPWRWPDSTPPKPRGCATGWRSRWTTMTTPPESPEAPAPPDAARPADAPALPPDGNERRLHPWSWLFVLLQQLRQFIVPLLVLLFLGRGDSYALWPLVGVAALAATSVWRYFTYRYRIDDDRL